MSAQPEPLPEVCRECDTECQRLIYGSCCCCRVTDWPCNLCRPIVERDEEHRDANDWGIPNGPN